MRDSTTLLRTQCDALRGLSAEQFKAAVLAIWDYELDGKEEQTDPIAALALGLVKPLIDKRERKSAVGTKNIEKRWGNDSNDIPTDTKAIPTDTNRILKEENIKKKEENIKDKKICGRFTPPTPDEVREYIREKGYNVDADKFCDFYESKGWMVGKNKMKDWKASVRTWARGQKEAKGTNKFNNFAPSGTNWDDVADQIMEAELWGSG